jgi:hypothetical protein
MAPATGTTAIRSGTSLAGSGPANGVANAAVMELEGVGVPGAAALYPRRARTSTSGRSTLTSIRRALPSRAGLAGSKPGR